MFLRRRDDVLLPSDFSSVCARTHMAMLLLGWARVRDIHGPSFGIGSANLALYGYRYSCVTLNLVLLSKEASSPPSHQWLRYDLHKPVSVFRGQKTHEGKDPSVWISISFAAFVLLGTKPAHAWENRLGYLFPYVSNVSDRRQ